MSIRYFHFPLTPSAARLEKDFVRIHALFQQCLAFRL
jgi:hypothetical protein